MLFRFVLAALAAGTVTARAEAPDFHQIPFLSDAASASIQRDYERVRCKQTYMVAVSPNGHWASRCSGNKLSSTITSAVLQKCEHSAGQPCGLAIAKGRNLPDWRAVSSLVYAETVSPESIPFVDGLRGRDVVARYTAARRNKALALSRNGAWAYASGRLTMREAEQAALSNCEENDGNRMRCFLYASGNEVVFGPETDIYPER
ncbi:DUF4189 domain-containing protein [Leisingera caerulea]|uniref:DUF4189 domain-containing protein n=1 Tax=Leisingera caerulea TaxID=506591 RepID=A0A9Q9HCT0_LEICA|nr:DUF4189 domain-containing protein [Leisingera caerulea]UWQ52769.1 DUF4189 domain-containing protein [Leisingera caerulea]